MEAAVQRDYHRARVCAWKAYSKMPFVGIELEELEAIALSALVTAAGCWVTPYCSSRGFDPWDPADPSKPHQAWAAYSTLRMNGAISDFLRKQDHVSRSSRGKLKRLEQARLDGARTDDELAAATGLPVATVRDVLARDGLRAVSLDGFAGDFSDAEQTPIATVLADQDPASDVEGQTVMSATLAAFMACFDALEPEVQVVLSLRYWRELELDQIAELMFTTESAVEALHRAGIYAIHDALLKAVSV